MSVLQAGTAGQKIGEAKDVAGQKAGEAKVCPEQSDMTRATESLPAQDVT